MKVKRIGFVAVAATAVFALASCNGEPEKTKTYTSNGFLASTTSLQWNPIAWETADDNSMLSLMSSSLYDYEMNDTKDGYNIVCELAKDLPVDVTSSYAGKYGVAAGDKKKAWRVALNPDATWDNGDKITADDYVYTLQQALDQKQMNRRADSFYAGDLVVHNAKNYLYSGMVSYDKIDANKYSSVDAAIADGVDIYFDAWAAWGAKGYKNADGEECPQYLKFDDTTVYDDYNEESEHYLQDAFSGQDLFDMFKAAGKYADYYGTYSFTKSDTPVTTWDEVGFVKVDDYTFDVILDVEIQEPTSFYLPYTFGSFMLVHKDTYEAAWKTLPDGSKANMYGKELEFTRSYGPYKMTYFETDVQIKFDRNTEWYGYKEGATNGAEAHKGQYQTTNVVYNVIQNHSTQLLAFEKGEIDDIGLESADLEKYGSSDYLVYSPQSYTTKVSFNTDVDSLKAIEAEKNDGKNRTIQCVKQFREAVSYAIDRAYFTKSFTAAAAPGFGMFNYMYQYFNEDGTTTAYRDSQPAKEALVKLYGLEYGDGKAYATLNEAYQALSGYDLKKARALLVEAVDAAKAEGLYNDGQEVEIEFRVYNNDEIYINMVNYFDTQIKEAAKGTPLEGKISFKLFADEDYYETMYAGKAQFIYTTWGGASYGTYGVLSSCYCDDSTGAGNQMELGFDTSTVDVKINVNNKDYTYSLQAWAYYCGNASDKGASSITEQLGSFQELDKDTKNKIYAALEFAYLDSYVTIPVYYRQSAVLYSKKINYGSTTYIDLIGFGGLRHQTYNYSDEEWAEFSADASNLKY